MTESEFLQRIDRHVAQGNALIERCDAHMERGNALMERIDTSMEETRTFMREMTLRQERVAQHMVSQLGDQTVVLRDLHDEHVAFRHSLMRVHDRLEDLRPEDLG